eukprot:3074708-Alexandrium_andersonii.AAC.1
MYSPGDLAERHDLRAGPGRAAAFGAASSLSRWIAWARIGEGSRVVIVLVACVICLLGCVGASCDVATKSSSHG